MIVQKPYTQLFQSISQLLHQSKQNVVKKINTTMVATYWQIGKYIVEYEQGGADRAEYGKQTIRQLSEDLTKEFGRGFSERSLQKFRQFFVAFPNFADTVGEIENIGWSHIVRILHLKDIDEQLFFLRESSQQSWSLRELDRQINSALYQRIALSRDKEGVMRLSKKGQILEKADDAIKDSYVLEFLGLPQDYTYTEKELETAIISNLQSFLLEIGKGFSFVARQKRIRSDIDDYYIDLVFYNRLLQCHLLIDLKIGKIKHQDIGQMQMYVNYYDQEIKTEYEKPTIGLILCKEKDSFVLKYTLPKEDQIFAKQYQTYLPDKESLQKYLNEHIKDVVKSE